MSWRPGLAWPGYPGASKEDFARACAEAQLGFVEALPEKYHTFVGRPRDRTALGGNKGLEKGGEKWATGLVVEGFSLLVNFSHVISSHNFGWSNVPMFDG